MRKVFGIGETVLDIIFRNDQPLKAVPGGSTFNAMISIGRTGTPCAMATSVAIAHGVPVRWPPRWATTTLPTS